MKVNCRLVSAVLAIAVSAVSHAHAKNPQVGDIAPPFSMTTLEGEEISLESMKGKVVLLNFWATWCAPCREELPMMDGYYRIRKDAGLRVVAVTTENSVPTYKLKPLAAVLAIPMARKFKGKYKIMGAVPTSYIIDRQGIVRYAKAGAFTLDAMNRILIPLLEEAEPVPAVQQTGLTGIKRNPVSSSPRERE
jgi:cytochrome c biogenesis protein CcmG, thiol:disulfide interchange protein DsbE